VLAALAVSAGLGACGDDGGGSGAASAGGDKERFCRLASKDELAGFESLDDFDATEADDMERLDNALEELTEAAPTEVRDDVRIVAEGVRELVDVLSGIDMDDPEALAELSERAEELEGMQAEMERATENVDRYLEEECGIDPEA
jgi:hypothetical protein